jgi:hypothetical protein
LDAARDGPTATVRTLLSPSGLVATTAGSSAAGVELPTDDCVNLPASLTKTVFFYFFMAGDHFFGKKKFF